MSVPLSHNTKRVMISQKSGQNSAIGKKFGRLYTREAGENQACEDADCSLCITRIKALRRTQMGRGIRMFNPLADRCSFTTRIRQADVGLTGGPWHIPITTWSFHFFVFWSCFGFTPTEIYHPPSIRICLASSHAPLQVIAGYTKPTLE